MDWVNYRFEALAAEWLGALIPIVILVFLFRRFLVKQGKLAPLLAGLGAWLLVGSLRALGGADGGSPQWLDGFTFMLVPVLAVIGLDFAFTKGGPISKTPPAR